MKEKFKHILNGVKPYAIPGLITFAVVVISLIFKGIWPFGSNRIDYFDNMQQVAPLYTHLWDWLHGDASLWFDWYTGLGTNVSMSISAFSMLSPFNLLLYLVPRSLILESISILTVVKMVFMSVSMYVLLNKRFPNLVYPLKATFAVMFSICGYVILYGSCFTPWMDIVALFPVLILAYDRLIDSGKKLFYIFMVALCFIINYYLSAMSLIYIFLISGAYMLIKVERKKWKEIAWNLGMGTVAGIGLSCFVLIPVVVQLSNSQRGNTGRSILDQYKGWIMGSVINDGTMAAFQRWMMLYGLSFVVAIIIIGLKKYWASKKETAYTGALLAIVLLPIVVEGTNVIWHFGSYNGYTLRMGYIIAFTLINVAAYYAQKLIKDIPTDKGVLKKQIIFAVAVGLIYMLGYNLMPNNNEVIAIVFFMAIFLSMTFVYYRKIREEKENFNYKYILAFVAMELFFGVYALIGPPKFYSYEDYQIGDYVQYANTAYKDLEIEDSATDRIVNPDISLNANYPLILRRGALSSFTAALQNNTQAYSKKWGYSKYFLWLLDSGGTVFTNALYHVTEAVNINPLDSTMYTLEKQKGDYSLYSAKYQLPFVTTVSSAFAVEDFTGNWIALHNTFYKALTGDNQNLVTGMTYSYKKTDTTIDYDVEVDKNSALYMSIVDVNNRYSDANSSWLISSMHIFVNDQPVLIPTLGDVKNTAYFTDYNNNLVYLGTFDDEIINIRVEYDDPWYLNVSEVSIAQLSMDKMDKLCEAYKDTKCDVSYTNNSLTLKFNGTPTKNYALIPVIYSDNWKIKLDGVPVQAKEIAGMFTGVKVHSGPNEIVMTFVPKGQKEGLLVSLATLLIVLMCVVVNYFSHVKVALIIKYCALFLYLQLYNAVIVFMFIIPLLAVIPAFIYQLVFKLMALF
jgi:uncharacterized membrane protein YfhO